MSEGSHGGKEDKNLGGSRFSGESAPLGRKSSHQVEGQETLESLFKQDKPPAVSKDKPKKKDKFYTVRAGVEYRDAPLGSMPGSPFAGRLTESTAVRIISEPVIRQGEASVLGVFKLGEESFTKWFSLNDIRARKNKPSR